MLKFIGYSLIVLPFLAIFILQVRSKGMRATLLLWGLCLFVGAIIALGVHLVLGG